MAPAEVVRLTVAPQGEAIDPEDVERTLAEHPDITTVFVTHNETSTGVTNDLSGIAGVVKSRGKMLAVDSVSGAGCLPLETDALGIDVLVTGSLQGLDSPGGRASWGDDRSHRGGVCAFRDRHQPSFLSRLRPREEVAGQEADGHDAAGLGDVRAPGRPRDASKRASDNVWSHACVGRMIRAGVQAMGMRLLAAAGHRSNTVTAVHSPADTPEALKNLLTTLGARHTAWCLRAARNRCRGRSSASATSVSSTTPTPIRSSRSSRPGSIDTGLRTRGGLAIAAAQSEARGTVAQAEPVTVG